MAATTESPESRLYDAGFTRQLEFWLSPDGRRVLNLDDAVAALDGGHIKPTSHGFPDTGVRALPDELVAGSARRSSTGNRSRRLGWWRRQK